MKKTLALVIGMFAVTVMLTGCGKGGWYKVNSGSHINFKNVKAVRLTGGFKVKFATKKGEEHWETLIDGGDNAGSEDLARVLKKLESSKDSYTFSSYKGVPVLIVDGMSIPFPTFDDIDGLDYDKNEDLIKLVQIWKDQAEDIESQVQ